MPNAWFSGNLALSQARLDLWDVFSCGYLFWHMPPPSLAYRYCSSLNKKGPLLARVLNAWSSDGSVVCRRYGRFSLSGRSLSLQVGFELYSLALLHFFCFMFVVEDVISQLLLLFPCLLLVAKISFYRGLLYIFSLLKVEVLSKQQKNNQCRTCACFGTSTKFETSLTKGV